MTAGQGRPQWILSTYGPGRAAPASLLEDNEYSFEELRLRYYELASAGNEAQADQEAGALWSKAEDGMRAIAHNADDVIKFMEDAEKKHPNRYDFCQIDGTKTREELAKAAKAAEASDNSFGGGFGQASAATGFGMPTFGQPAASSGFGQSGFGQPVQSANPFAQPSAATGFGQPSRPAQPANPFAQPSAATGFGKPAFGQPGAGVGFGQSGFGQPSQPATSGFNQPTQQSAFGAPAFGQPSQPTSGFGQPSQPTPAFGQPSQPAQSANPFAKPAAGFSQPSQTGFGQPSQPTTSTFSKPAAPGGFAQSGFGQPSQPATSGFGLPTQAATPSFGQPSQPALSAFGQPSQPATSGFGQPSQPAATGFAAGAGFGTKSPSTSPFNQPSTATATGGFGQPSNPAPSTGFASAANSQSPQVTNPLTGQPTAALHYTETLPKRATNFRPGTKDVTSYAGRQVQHVNDAPCYDRPDGRGLERIWFPEFGNGADVLALNAPGKKDDLESRAEDYTEEVKQAYVHLFTKGGFGEAGMPMVPPMREWCAFDF